MRILLINDFLYAGGAEVVFRRMESALRDLGNEVDMFYWKDRKCMADNPLDYVYNFKSASALEHRLLGQRYSLIIVFNYTSALSPSVLGVLKKYKKSQHFKVIYNSHDAHLICPNSGLNFFSHGRPQLFDEYTGCRGFMFKCLDHRGRIYSCLKKIQWLLAYRVLHLHKVIDKVISPSHALLDRIQKFYPDLEGCVIRNPCLESVDVQERCKSGNKSLKLIFIGRLSDEKGLLPLIDALAETDSPYVLDIFGSGPQEQEMRTAISQNGLDGKVNLNGHKSHKEIMELLGHYDALILPSVMSETAPMSIVEAASKKLFVLTMDYGGMKEMAERVGNYVFINPISARALDEAFETIRHKEFSHTDLTDFTYESYKDALRRELM